MPYVKRVPVKKRKKPQSRDESMMETRAALIDAALDLFAKDGLDASLDAICEHAGFTRGAFYVHFPDRDALLVAVMEKVGAQFLARMFATPDEGEGLAGAAARFMTAVTAGDYPLMAPGRAQIQFHQLLDACARSPKVRAQYRALVEASVVHVAGLTTADQSAGAIRADLEPSALATAMLAMIIGAQTMSELGVAVDAPSLAKTLLAAIRR